MSDVSSCAGWKMVSKGKLQAACRRKGERIIMVEQKLKCSEDLVSTVRSVGGHFGLCSHIRGEEEINGMPEKKGQWINKLHK